MCLQGTESKEKSYFLGVGEVLSDTSQILVLSDTSLFGMCLKSDGENR